MGTGVYGDGLNPDAEHRIAVRGYPGREVAKRLYVGAYSVCGWLRLCRAFAVIPPLGNASSWKILTAGAVAGNGALRESKYPGRAIRRNRSGYRYRSRAGTKPPEVMPRMTLPVSECTAWKCRACALWQGTSAVGSRTSMSASPSRTAALPVPYPSQTSWPGSIWGQRWHGHRPVCATVSVGGLAPGKWMCAIWTQEPDRYILGRRRRMPRSTGRAPVSSGDSIRVSMSISDGMGSR